MGGRASLQGKLCKTDRTEMNPLRRCLPMPARSLLVGKSSTPRLGSDLTVVCNYGRQLEV